MVRPNESLSSIMILSMHGPHLWKRGKCLWISRLRIGDSSTRTFCLTLFNHQLFKFLCLAPLLIFTLHSCSCFTPLHVGFTSMVLHTVSVVKITCSLNHAHHSLKSAVGWRSTDVSWLIILTFGSPISAPAKKNLQVLTLIPTTGKGWTNGNSATYLGPFWKLRSGKLQPVNLERPTDICLSGKEAAECKSGRDTAVGT